MQGMSKLWRRFWQWRQRASAKTSRPEDIQSAPARAAQTPAEETHAYLLPDQSRILCERADQQCGNIASAAHPEEQIQANDPDTRKHVVLEKSNSPKPSILPKDSAACTKNKEKSAICDKDPASPAMPAAPQHEPCMDKGDVRQQIEQSQPASAGTLADQAATSPADALQQAQQELVSLRLAQREADIEAALNMGLAQGKIVPAVLEYHRAQCRVDGGLQRFLDYCQAAPVIAGPSGLAEMPVYKGLQNSRHDQTTTPDPTRRHICQCLGISENELRTSADPATCDAFE